MEDYYRLLNIHYEASIEELNSAYKNKLLHFKSLPFLTDNDQEELKKLKKANAIFNNHEYKKTYDQYLQNSNYMVDRIFGFNSNNVSSINLKHNELLRPKNVGLSSDILPEFDKPIDYTETHTSKTKDFLPYNFDS
jgi:DnaJ-class molecular chaperone